MKKFFFIFTSLLIASISSYLHADRRSPVPFLYQGSNNAAYRYDATLGTSPLLLTESNTSHYDQTTIVHTEFWMDTIGGQEVGWTENTYAPKMDMSPSKIAKGFAYATNRTHRLIICGEINKTVKDCIDSGQRTETGIASARFKNGDYIAFSDDSSHAIKIGYKSSYCSSCDYSFYSIDHKTTQAPDLIEFKGKLYLFFKSTNRSRISYTSSTDGMNWSSLRTVNNNTTARAPTVVNYNGRLTLAYKGKDNNYFYIRHSSDAVKWTSYRLRKALKTPSGPGLAIDRQNKLHILFRGENNKIYISTKSSTNHFNTTWSNAEKVINTNGGKSISSSGRISIEPINKY